MRFGDFSKNISKPLDRKAIAEYIRNQIQEDLAYEQMSIKELVDPFTGEPVKASKK